MLFRATEDIQELSASCLAAGVLERSFGPFAFINVACDGVDQLFEGHTAEDCLGIRVWWIVRTLVVIAHDWLLVFRAEPVP